MYILVRKEKYPHDVLPVSKMNAVTWIICTSCDVKIDDECVVKQRNGIEEHYHPGCARVRNIPLPLQIKFI